MIHLVTTMATHPGQRSTLLFMLKALVPTVHREPGCLSYQPFVDAGDLGDRHAKLGPNSFVVLESWESVDALRTHGAAPHMQDFLAEAQPMLASLTINILSPA